MTESADLSITNPKALPTTPYPFNVSAHNDIFECKFEHRSKSLKFTLFRNFLQKRMYHVASSKSQISEQLKPMRKTHNVPNPSKSLLLKLSIPQQMFYLNFEEDHNMIERMQIYPMSQKV